MESVTLTLERYYELLQAEAHLSALQALGVDNWQGYTSIPRIEDFKSLEDWKAAIEAGENSGWEHIDWED